MSLVKDPDEDDYYLLHAVIKEASDYESANCV